MNEIIPARILNPLHIWFDIAFLLGFVFLLFVKKRYMTILFGLAGGLLYFIVDWGIFYKIMGTRQLFYNGADMPEAGKFFFLFWMSMSYGITNFAWIWLWLRQDKFLKEFSLYILLGWLAVAVTATGLGSELNQISIRRGTDKFHSFMAIFLIASYGAVIVYNIVNNKGKRLPIFRMLSIGILVQFGWEMALLLGGVRSPGYNPFDAVMTVLVNSLIETNPAAPCIFFIQAFIYKRRREDLGLASRVLIDDKAILTETN